MNTIYTDKLALMLKFYVVAVDTSYEQIAKEIGISHPQLMNILRGGRDGKYNVRDKTMEKLLWWLIRVK